MKTQSLLGSIQTFIKEKLSLAIHVWIHQNAQTQS